MTDKHKDARRQQLQECLDKAQADLYQWEAREKALRNMKVDWLDKELKEATGKATDAQVRVRQLKNHLMALGPEPTST